MNSLPTVEQVNLDNYLDIVRKFDPELYLTRVALKETNVNPLLLPRIIRALANVAYGTGYGKIQIFIQEGRVTQIKPEESDQVELAILMTEAVRLTQK